MRIRREAKDYFTWVHNAFIYDKRLSLAERGLLLLLISLPMNWKFSVTGIATMIAEGRDKVSSTLKALEKHGYLKREQQFKDNGSFANVLYTFSDEPIFSESSELNADDFTQISGASDEDVSEDTGSSPFTGDTSTETTFPSNDAQYNKENIQSRIYKSSIKKEEMCCEAARPPLEAERQPAKKAVSKAKKGRKPDNKAAYAEIIEHLNLRAGTDFNPTNKLTRDFIDRWLGEKYTVDDFKRVIDRKCAEWLDNEMAMHLCPSTLFGKRFEDYLKAPIPKKQGTKSISEKPRDYSISMMDLINESMEE